MSERRLWLIRHAKAKRRGPTDHDRELSHRGFRQCVEMGQRMAELALPPQLFLSSSARRAYTSAHILCAFVQGRVISLDDLYTFDVDALELCVAQLTELEELTNVTSLALVGHNSAMSDLAEDLVQDRSSRTLSTLGMVELAFTGNWQDLFSSDVSLRQQFAP